MSRIKDYLLPAIQAQQELDLWIGYEEYLKSCNQSPTAIELDQMEEDSIYKNNCIVAHAANNINYNHPKGA